MLRDALQKLSEFILSPNPKAVLESNVDISKEDSSNHAIGTGRTDKIVNRSGTINLNNSTTNNYNFHIQIPSNPTPEELASIRNSLLSEFKSGNLQFIKSDSAQDIEDYNTFETSNNSRTIIQFFTGKINAEDLQLLRTGLFIKTLINNNDWERALHIKDNATKDRHSRNVINLATAGYFESYIQPIFENNDIESATKEYEEVVRYLPEIIFVNNNMTPEDIICEIEDKIKEKEQYHMEVRKIMINGIGRQCTLNICSAEQQLRQLCPQYKISSETRSLNKLTQCKMQILLNDYPSTNQKEALR